MNSILLATRRQILCREHKTYVAFARFAPLCCRCRCRFRLLPLLAALHRIVGEVGDKPGRWQHLGGDGRGTPRRLCSERLKLSWCSHLRRSCEGTLVRCERYEPRHARVRALESREAQKVVRHLIGYLSQGIQTWVSCFSGCHKHAVFSLQLCCIGCSAEGRAHRGRIVIHRAEDFFCHQRLLLGRTWTGSPAA